MTRALRLSLNRQAWATRLAQFDMEILVGYILQIGVLLSMTLIAIGVVWRWMSTGVLGLDYTIAGMNFSSSWDPISSRWSRARLDRPCW